MSRPNLANPTKETKASLDPLAKSYTPHSTAPKDRDAWSGRSMGRAHFRVWSGFFLLRTFFCFLFASGFCLVSSVFSYLIFFEISENCLGFKNGSNSFFQILILFRFWFFLFRFWFFFHILNYHFQIWFITFDFLVPQFQILVHQFQILVHRLRIFGSPISNFSSPLFKFWFTTFKIWTNLHFVDFVFFLICSDFWICPILEFVQIS